MKPFYKSILGLVILSISSMLVSMAPGPGPRFHEGKTHVIHQGIHLCLSSPAYEAHHRKHIGIIDCEVRSTCTLEDSDFHKK